MTPEEKARRNIDRQLVQCGWLVQDYRQMDISAGPGVAVREFPLATGEADYLLYADAKAVGAVEAKPEGHTLTGVEELQGQQRRKLRKMPPLETGKLWPPAKRSQLARRSTG
jgi:type I restriction enzyme R subunit